jgi:hypothetical protein
MVHKTPVTIHLLPPDLSIRRLLATISVVFAIDGLDLRPQEVQTEQGE